MVCMWGGGESLSLIFKCSIQYFLRVLWQTRYYINLVYKWKEKIFLWPSQCLVARKVKDSEQTGHLRVMRKPGMKVTQVKLWNKIITELKGIWRAYANYNPWAKILPATCELIMVLFGANTVEHTVLQACHRCYHLDTRIVVILCRHRRLSQDWVH